MSYAHTARMDSHNDLLANCRHSKLRAALQFPGQQAWAAPKTQVEFEAEDAAAATLKFYLYTTGVAVMSLASFLVTSMITA